ncbi:MAG: MarR family winged helix-turn-helix transcriptional regulator [Candidatus Saccharimonadales bacterium]
MLNHHLQRDVVYRLAQADSLSFTELKPRIIDNKLFTYHLKQVVSAGYVAKGADGRYSLTAEGRRLSVRVFDKPQDFVDRAESVLFLLVRRKADNAWLFYRRLTHPLINQVGFMHALPDPKLDSAAVAQQALADQTGLTGSFTALGGGIFRVYRDKELESFTHFTLLVSEDAAGQLMPTDEYADYFWTAQPNFAAKDMLPNMTTLVDYYQAGQPFYVEKTLSAAAE